MSDAASPPPRSAFTIWIDADACPRDVKDIIFRASQRRHLAVCLVANRDLKIPHSPLISKLVVPGGLDMADSRIVEEVSTQDVVITADIPLAALIVAKGAVALDPRGELYTEANVRERLSVRDFMADMRGAGVAQGGPAGYSAGDRQRFADAFDRVVTKRLRG